MTAISRERPPVPGTDPAAADNGTSAGGRPLPVLRAERAAVPALARSAAPPPSDDIRKLPLTRPLLNRLVAGGFLAALLVFVTGTAIGISLGLHLYRDMAVTEPALTMALPPSVDVTPPPEPLPAPAVSPAPPPVLAEEEVAPPGETAALTAQTAPEPQAAPEPDAPAPQEAEPVPAVPVAAADRGFVIQVAMFNRAANAEQMVRSLQAKSLPAYSRIRQNNQQLDRFFVYAGPFPSRDDAQAAIPDLRKSGITDPLRVRQATETDLP